MDSKDDCIQGLPLSASYCIPLQLPPAYVNQPIAFIYSEGYCHHHSCEKNG
jgi:hypothetical protein